MVGQKILKNEKKKKKKSGNPGDYSSGKLIVFAGNMNFPSRGISGSVSRLPDRDSRTHVHVGRAAVTALNGRV